MPAPWMWCLHTHVDYRHRPLIYELAVVINPAWGGDAHEPSSRPCQSSGPRPLADVPHIPLHGLLLSQAQHVVLVQADYIDEELEEPCGHGGLPGWRGRRATTGRKTCAEHLPELGFACERELVSPDTMPQSRVIVRRAAAQRYTGTQDVTALERLAVTIVVWTPCLGLLPAVELAEASEVLPIGDRHRVQRPAGTPDSSIPATAGSGGPEKRRRSNSPRRSAR